MKVSEVDETILAEYARLDDPSDIELKENEGKRGGNDHRVYRIRRG